MRGGNPHEDVCNLFFVFDFVGWQCNGWQAGTGHPDHARHLRLRLNTNIPFYIQSDGLVDYTKHHRNCIRYLQVALRRACINRVTQSDGKSSIHLAWSYTNRYR
jgi:hypothetical protein